MVYLTEAAMDRLKGKTPHAKSLEMTPDEKARAGQYFRIQIPIRDRGALEQAAGVCDEHGEYQIAAAIRKLGET
jgi:hypothetical protein